MLSCLARYCVADAHKENLVQSPEKRLRSVGCFWLALPTVPESGWRPRRAATAPGTPRPRLAWLHFHSTMEIAQGTGKFCGCMSASLNASTGHSIHANSQRMRKRMLLDIAKPYCTSWAVVQVQPGRSLDWHTMMERIISPTVPSLPYPIHNKLQYPSMIFNTFHAARFAHGLQLVARSLAWSISSSVFSCVLPVFRQSMTELSSAKRTRPSNRNSADATGSFTCFLRVVMNMLAFAGDCLDHVWHAEVTSRGLVQVAAGGM